MSESRKVQKVFTKPSRTKQSFKKECDVNHIMEKFKRVMGADYLNRYNSVVDGRFGDFTQVADYRTALDQVNRASEVFMALPAKVRSRFYNDPAEFLDFCSNPANADELVSLGLAEKKPVVSDGKVGVEKG